MLLLFLAIPIINASMPTLRAMTSRLAITPDQSWTPGPLASGHEGFGHDCSKCHELPFVRVRNRTCLGCHQKIPGHAPTAKPEAELFGATRCASCHADHKGDDGLVRTDVGLCADCHRDLKRRVPDTKLADASDFAGAHPDFKVSLWRGPGNDDGVRVVQSDKAHVVENSHLKFPHDASEAEHSQRQGPRHAPCRSCHAPDTSGRSFEPVVMKTHCIECHTLEFEPAVTTRQVPHGSVDDVMTTMQEFYASIVLNAVAVDTIDTGDIRRAIPKPAAGAITEEQRQRALGFARAKADRVAQDLFEARVCIVCHEVVRKPVPKGKPGNFTFDVAKVHVATTYLPKSRFDHEKHRTYKCDECHDKVATSKTSADVAVPSIETCRKCHAGGAGGEQGGIDLRRMPRFPPSRSSADGRSRGCVGNTPMMSRRTTAPAAGIAFALIVAGCGGDGGSGSGGCGGACETGSPTALTVADVRQVIAQAAAEAGAQGAKATIAVVDRVGNVLAVFRMNGALATFTITSGRGVTGGLEGLNILPSELAAISKAVTGAYLSSEGNAFSTRTASQIIQQNFNPGEANQPSGPLSGVQFSQLSCSDINRQATAGTIGPKRAPLGLAADPGGLPLYKNGTVVGGIGIMADGIYTVDLDIIDSDTDVDELIAVAGTFGFAAPADRRANQITVDGRTLRYVDSESLASNPAMAPPFAAFNGIAGALVDVPGYGGNPIVAGVAFGTPASGYAGWKSRVCRDRGLRSSMRRTPFATRRFQAPTASSQPKLLRC